ncbi:hypothetical protein [Faecalispora anaeroviscerum]|uniref:hypothetical protein n=1 Tax=Faecalispora anaeroviscerum TaxID=2991836 RepID=UPI0024BB8459|nr:hypothetical protein [Faecalispora anaeroviscerum]
MNGKTTNTYLNVSDEEKADILRSYGFTEQEVQYYVWQESNKNPERLTFGPNSKSSGISIMAFPSNPKIGDTYRISSNGNYSGRSFRAGNSKSTHEEKADSNSCGLAALGVAASIAQIYGDSKGYRGYNITINYLYTYDNDVFANWVYSKLVVKGYK